MFNEYGLDQTVFLKPIIPALGIMGQGSYESRRVEGTHGDSASKELQTDIYWDKE